MSSFKLKRGRQKISCLLVTDYPLISYKIYKDESHSLICLDSAEAQHSTVDRKVVRSNLTSVRFFSVKSNDKRLSLSSIESKVILR